MNDYVRPIMTNYLPRIEDRLASDEVSARLHIVHSDGGLMSADTASKRPVHTVLSGLAEPFNFGYFPEAEAEAAE